MRKFRPQMSPHIPPKHKWIWFLIAALLTLKTLQVIYFG